MTENCPRRSLIGTVTIPVGEYRQLVEAAAIAEIRTEYERKIIDLTQQIRDEKADTDKWFSSYLKASNSLEEFRKQCEALKAENEELQSRCRNLEWQEK